MADFKSLTRNRDLKLGTYIGEFATPGIGKILKTAGCEFVFFDMEHSGFSFETAKATLRAVHDAGIATLIRPPSQRVDHLSRACDIGAQGVIPPMLGTADQARACINAIKYWPEGNRGAAFGIAHDDYQPASVCSAMKSANAKISFVSLIETSEGVENCEEIAAIEGVDCLWIGHLDLSISLGIPGEFDNPVFENAVAQVMTAAKACGKSVGRLLGSPQEAKRMNSEGCDFICYSGDLWLYRQALQDGLSAARSAIEE